MLHHTPRYRRQTRRKHRPLATIAQREGITAPVVTPTDEPITVYFCVLSLGMGESGPES